MIQQIVMIGLFLVIASIGALVMWRYAMNAKALPPTNDLIDSSVISAAFELLIVAGVGAFFFGESAVNSIVGKNIFLALVLGILLVAVNIAVAMIGAARRMKADDEAPITCQAPGSEA